MTDGIIYLGHKKFAVFVQKASWDWKKSIQVILEVDTITCNWLREKLLRDETFHLEIEIKSDGKPHRLVTIVKVDRLPLKNSLYTEVYLSGKEWEVVEGELENIDVSKEKVVFT